MKCLHQHQPNAEKLGHQHLSSTASRATIMWSMAAVVALLASQILVGALTSEDIAIRKQLKANIFSSLTNQEGARIASGNSTLTENFVVKESTFLHFVIPDVAAEGFAKEIKLPEGMELAKVKILEWDRPYYYLTANPYRANLGPAPIERLEWLTFVTTEEDTVPRYLVIEGYTNDERFDIVSGPEPSNNYTYVAVEGLASGLVEVAVTDIKTQFNVSFTVPKKRLRNTRRLSKMMASAVSKNYYRNSIYDYSFFNDDFTEARLTRVSRRNVHVAVKHSRFGRFTYKKPRHTLLYTEPISFITQLWVNLYDPAINKSANPVIIAAAQEFMQQKFAQLRFYAAAQLENGSGGEAITSIKVDEQPPAIFINFIVPFKNLKKFKEMISLPANLKLARQAIISPLTHTHAGRNRHSHIPSKHYMIALNVYHTSIGGQQGFRAEWSTFVTSEDDGHRKPYFNVVDVSSSIASLDVINLFTQPAEKFVYAKNKKGDIITNIIDGDLKFEASFPFPDINQCRRGVDYNFIRANDRIYWGNTSVYDRGYYNDEAFNAKITIIPPSKIKVLDNTRWAGIINPIPFQTFAFCNSVTYVVQPWLNIEEIEPIDNVDVDNNDSDSDACKTIKPLDDFNLEQYASKKWYSHQQREQPFTSEALFYCISAEYSFLDYNKLPFEALGLGNGFTIKIFNKGQDVNGTVFTSDDEFAEGGMKVPSPLCAGQGVFDGDKDSQITVGFCAIPVAAFQQSNYYVLAYNEEDGAALIAGGQADVPNTNGDGLCTYSNIQNGLWIFSRSPVRNETLIEKYRNIAIDNGIDPSMMKDVLQVDCSHNDRK